MGPDEAAHYLGMSRTTILAYIDSGQLRTTLMPAARGDDEYLKRTLISKDELDRLIDRGVRVG
jgi:predicted site-specific integrase-resolvase